jgi:uncharacterized protein
MKMNTNDNSYSDLTPESPQLRLTARRFRPRTVLIPLLFLGLHFLVVNIIALLYVMVYVLITGFGQGADILSSLQDQARLEAIILEQYPLITVFYSAAVIPVYLIYLTLAGRRDQRSLLRGPVRLNDLLPALAMMIGALGVTNLWFNLLTWLQERVPYVEAQMQDYLRTAGAFSPDAGYVWLILGVSILAPVAEELIFRGIIQGELRKAMPEWAAIIIQALIFALFHLQPIQITYVLLPGLLLGLAYAWSRSIWVPIIMHILFNFLGSVVPALIGTDETLGDILFVSEVAFILVGVLATVFFWLNHRNRADPRQYRGV